MGQIQQAIEYYEQALAIAKEGRRRKGEGIALGNLGNRYAELGQTARAIEFYEQALAIDREIGDRRDEGTDLCNLAEALIDEGLYEKVIECARESVKIGNEIGEPNSHNNGYLALAYLCTNNLQSARAAVEEAQRNDVPQNNHYVCALLGVILLRQGDGSTAQPAFTEAITHADKVLVQTPRYYAALDAKGLALCGLALCGEAARVNDAIAAYRAARKIIQDAGVVKRVLRLFDALAVVDTEGILRDVRPAAAGQ